MALLLVTDSAFAQTGQIDAYVFGGPGRFSGDSLNFSAAGAEFVSRRGVGVGIEIGRYWGIGPYFYKRDSEANTASDLHIVFTRPRTEGARIAPFFVAGLSFFSNPQSDSYMGAVFGLGTNIWLTKHVAVRLDGRIPFLATHSSTGGGTVGLGISVR
jgi:hypothetical protein